MFIIINGHSIHWEGWAGSDDCQMGKLATQISHVVGYVESNEGYDIDFLTYNLK